MPAEFRLPRLGPAMQDATVVEWKKKEGDVIRKYDIIVTVESEKAAQDLEAMTDGLLYRIVARAGETVPVNALLAIIRLLEDGAEDLGECGLPAADLNVEKKSQAQTAAPTETSERIRISPLARKVASSRGVEISQLAPGSGPGGRIIERDVLAFCEAQNQATPKPAPAQTAQAADPGERRIPITGFRRHAIEMLRRCKDNIVPVTSVTEIDLTSLLDLYRQVKPVWEETHKITVTLNAFFVRAVALALRKHEILNSTLADNEIVIKGSINIGLAMDVNEALYVPVIKRADSLAVVDIAKQIARYAQAAEHRALRAEDLEGATFTITNVGPFDVLFSTPVVVYPQVGILGIGKISERPVFEGDSVVKRYLCCFALTYDHRVVDGKPAALFRATLKELMEKPVRLLV